ncbi:hypothetical protein [Paenibacillus wulumuqiensis]|uniref:hypothetical protein n=1 Tax=Paenibacillus wulumuqiensis TaxID=1567107 RepID=UPI000B2DC3E3|nr:hypothetical protein [Paenibacillus wulumuqiensis]
MALLQIFYYILRDLIFAHINLSGGFENVVQLVALVFIVILSLVLTVLLTDNRDSTI